MIDLESIGTWVAAASKIFADFGFVRANGWWKNEEAGVYAVVDNIEMGHGKRYSGVYTHRIDAAGTDYMAGLVMVPWYGDGADLGTAKRLLMNGISTILNRSSR